MLVFAQTVYHFIGSLSEAREAADSYSANVASAGHWDEKALCQASIILRPWKIISVWHC
jgi:hypothetical protein